MAANIEILIEILGGHQPPANITQKPFDYDPRHYYQLCENPLTPDPTALYSYADDLKYMDIQVDLFHFLFPVCLRAWRHNLMNSHNSIYCGFVEQFSSAMAKHTGFVDILTSAQYEAVAAFMKDTILDKIDLEQNLSFSGMGASPYCWISAFTSFGTFFPFLSQLWNEWWSASTIGRACGILQYVSALMYSADKNPIFTPWTWDAGGGAPALWETDGFIYDQFWLKQNVNFLQSILTPDYIQKSITVAATFLQEKINSPVPDKMIHDFSACRNLVNIRIEKLMQLLSRPLIDANGWDD